MRRGLALALLVPLVLVGCSKPTRVKSGPSYVAGTGRPIAASAAPSSAADTGSSHLAAAASLVPQIQDIENRLIVKCLQDKGFAIIDPELSLPASTDLALPAIGDYSRVVISPSLADATRYGYSKPAAAQSPGAKLQQKPSRNGPFYQQSQQYQTRFEQALGQVAQVSLANGTEVTIPQGGCRLSVDQQIFTDVNGYYAASDGLFEVYDVPAQQALQAAAVQSATTAWSGCMHSAGYDYASPTELINNKDQAVVADPADIAGKRKEIAIATADARCADSSGIRAATQHAWDAALSSYLAAHETSYLADQQLFQAALARATSVLAK